MGSLEERIARNVGRVRERIAQVADKVARPVESVRLVAVTKYAGLAEMRALLQCGISDFGEARVQEAEVKARELAGSGLHWHLIGHLQTNKADKAARLFEAVHSVDSPRVALALNKERLKQAAGAPFLPLTCLLEINVAQEPAKYGLNPALEEITAVLSVCAALPGLRVAGLMTMAPHSADPESTSRPVFRKLRELLAQANAQQCYPQPLTELSMGMTQDYLIAVEEGATLLRVGSALFEP